MLADKPSGLKPLGSGHVRVLILLGTVAALALVAAVGGVIGLRAARRAVDQLHPPRAVSTQDEFLGGLPGSELVSFRSHDGTRLAGTFVAPKNGAAVVLAHGLGSNRLQVLPEAKLLVDNGYGVLLFDLRDHGASEGALSTWGYLEGGDVQRAVDFVEQRTALPAGRIGLLGFSIGGTAVVRAAVSDARVGPVILEADFRSVAAEFRYMFARFGPLSQLPALWAIQAAGIDLSAVEVDQLVPALQPRPLLLVYGTHDPAVPPTEADWMARAAGPASSVLMVETAEHGGYMQSAPAEYSERLLSFLSAALPSR